MLIRNTSSRWGAVSKFFHWTTALLVLGMVGLGYYMTWLDNSQVMQKFQLYQLHKSIGFVVLTISLIRFVWRISNPVPELPLNIPVWERWAANTVHLFLYSLLVALPLSGWLMAAASPLNIPTILFGVLPVPHPVSPDPKLYELMRDTHETLVIVLLGTLALHVGGALKHHFITRDDTLLRMLPGKRSV